MVDHPSQPTDDGQAKVQPRRLTWRLAGAGLLALGLLAVLLLACVLWIPKGLYPPLTDTDLQNVSDPAKVHELKDARLKLQNDARTTLLQGLGGLLVLTGAAGGVWATLRQVRASHEQLKLSEQGQVTDRYTKAIDQLDEEKALAVRLGGLYALERIAHDSPDDRGTIAEVLCAYARTALHPKPPAPRAEDANPPGADTPPSGTPAAKPPSLTVRAPDVQAVLAILGRWRERLGEPPPVLDLHNADLQGARLSGAQLQGANLYGAQLQGAVLYRVQLQGALLNTVQLQGAFLDSVQLQSASLHSAQLQGAVLHRAQLQNATLDRAQLQSADLYCAQLQGASLYGAQLQGALLDDAELQDARATEARGWATRWPEGWDDARAKAAGVRFVAAPAFAPPREE